MLCDEKKTSLLALSLLGLLLVFFVIMGWTKTGAKLPMEISASGPVEIPELHLYLKSGALVAIHADKNEKQRVSCVCRDLDGSVIRTDGLLSGRGNSTWDEVEELGLEEFKHPYNLNLSSAASLFGMSITKKYVLLANYYDPSFMKNYVALSIASAIGIPYTPEAVFVDLYADGEYLGLYLLTQKIDVGDGCLDRDITELYCFDFKDRVAEERNAIFTEHAAVNLKHPSAELSDEALEQKKEELQSVEDAIWQDAPLDDLLILDNYAAFGLMQEFFCNHDADTASQYFYRTDRDPRLSAGPVWDFDLSMGHEWASFGGLETKARWNRSTVLMRGWLYELEKRQEYQEECRRCYLQSFSPAMHAFLEENSTGPDSFAAMRDRIRNSALRDNGRYPAGSDFDTSCEELRQWLTERLAFMDAWMAEPDEWCTVTLAISCTNYGRRDLCYCVRKGEALGPLPLIDPVIGWKTAEGGPLPDDMLITEDMTVFPVLKGNDY